MTMVLELEVYTYTLYLPQLYTTVSPVGIGGNPMQQNVQRLYGKP